MRAHRTDARRSFEAHRRSVFRASSTAFAPAYTGIQCSRSTQVRDSLDDPCEVRPHADRSVSSRRRLGGEIWERAHHGVAPGSFRPMAAMMRVVRRRSDHPSGRADPESGRPLAIASAAYSERMTRSMRWMTPLDARMSVSMTVAPPTTMFPSMSWATEMGPPSV